MASLSSFTIPHLNLLTTSSSRRQRGGAKSSDCQCERSPKTFCCSPKKPVFVVQSTTRFKRCKLERKSSSSMNENITLVPCKPPSCAKPIPKPPPPPPPPMECYKRITFKEPPCCCPPEDVPDISQQLAILIKTLEMQVAVEARQKEQLNSINDQLKCLSSTVQNLSEKCKNLKPEPCCLAPPTEFCCGGEDITPKTSSVCNFCRDKNLPVLYSMHKELYRLIGCRSFKDIALTILLRPDNIYHVNVRDLKSDEVLGCLLVSDVGIREANKLGIFYDITTFCVIDSRNTLTEYKDGIFGGLKFEFIGDRRLAGGHTGQSSPTCVPVEPTSTATLQELSLPPPPPPPSKELTQVFCLTELLRASRLPRLKTSEQTLIHDKSLTQFKELAEAVLLIECIDSKLLLSDDEAHHRVRSITLTNLMDSSDEEVLTSPTLDS